MAIPIIIMGTALEIGKLVTAVWLHRYWDLQFGGLRHIIVAVVVLMFITSMGIFGYHPKHTLNKPVLVQKLQKKYYKLTQTLNVKCFNR